MKKVGWFIGSFDYWVIYLMVCKSNGFAFNHLRYKILESLPTN